MSEPILECSECHRKVRRGRHRFTCSEECGRVRHERKRRERTGSRQNDGRSLVVNYRNLHRRARNLAKYGLTPESYVELLEFQGGGCAICGMTEEENGKALALDHNHKTGDGRGALCISCNASLLPLGENDPRRFLRAFDYLKNPPLRSFLDGEGK